MCKINVSYIQIYLFIVGTKDKYIIHLIFIIHIVEKFKKIV